MCVCVSQKINVITFLIIPPIIKEISIFNDSCLFVFVCNYTKARLPYVNDVNKPQQIIHPCFGAVLLRLDL